jgi:hypothetical protein
MKKILTLLIIASLTTICFGQRKKDVNNFEIKKSTIFMEGGAEIEGLIDFPLTENDKYIRYKDENGKQKIDKEEISKIIFETTAGDKLEYINMKVFNDMNSKIQERRRLLMLSVSGKVSLYFNSVDQKQYNFNSATGNRSNVEITCFYVIRKGEEAASLIHIDGAFANKNIFFRMNGKKYFADNAAIATKIENKEYIYKNLYEVIELYNSK